LTKNPVEKPPQNGFCGGFSFAVISCLNERGKRDKEAILAVVAGANGLQPFAAKGRGIVHHNRLFPLKNPNEKCAIAKSLRSPFSSLCRSGEGGWRPAPPLAGAFCGGAFPFPEKATLVHQYPLAILWIQSYPADTKRRKPEQ
jgi:hypothetical protein